MSRAAIAGKISFSRSGWFLVRAIADVAQTFRFASTGPFYVETEGRRSRSWIAVVMASRKPRSVLGAK